MIKNMLPNRKGQWMTVSLAIAITMGLSSNRVLAQEAHTVQAKDTLFSIANRYGVTVPQLMEWNNLNSTVIYTGSHLIVSQETDNVSQDSTENIETTTEELGNETTFSSDTNATETVPSQAEPEQLLTRQSYTNSNSSQSTYIVQKGDYLHKIANQFGVSVQNLIDWNNLTSNYIYVGDVLKVSNSANTTPTAPTSPSPNPETPPVMSSKTYTVKAGDYLHKIATQYGVTVENLKDWNNLSNNYIYVGDVLKVSKPTSSTPTPPSPKPETPPVTSSKTYTVKAGDYLYKIAAQFGVSVENLKQWNKMTNNYVYVGDVLYIQAPSVNTGTPIQSTGSIPDLSALTPVSVNYDVKLNNLNDSLRTTRSLTGNTYKVSDYFGQKFTVLKEYSYGGKKYMELLNQYGTVIGYAPTTAGVQVPQGVNTVYIDAGHGGSESGASNWGVQEKNLNLNITRQLSQRLRDQGYHVYESRVNDKEIPLYQRTFEPNKLMPDAYISVHHNAMPIPGTAHGIVTLYHDPSIDEPDYPTMKHHYGTDIIPEGKRLSREIQNALIRATGANDQGIRPQNLHVTRKTDVPATLVELGFMDHWSEHQKLINSTYQQKLINGLVNGINAYFGKTR